MSERSDKSTIALVVAGTIAALVWLTAFHTGRVEIGVPGEWVWERHVIAAAIDVAIPIVLTVAVAGGYFAVVRKVSGTLDAKPGRAWFAIPVVAASGFFVLWALQSCAPSPHRQLKPMWVLYHWGSAGYFAEASELESLDDYLAKFEEEMEQGDVLHKGTHPPGLVLANYGLLSLCRNQPAFSETVVSTIPRSVADAFEKRLSISNQRIPNSDLAALWLSVLLTQLAAAMTVVPLYGLMRWRLDAVTSLSLASLWPFVPGVAIFLPKSDAIYPLLATTFLLLSLGAWDKGSLWRALLAGLVFWVGMMLSLAMLPIAVMAALHALVRIRSDRPRPVGMSLAVGGVLAGFAIATGVFYAVTEIALWRTWVLNYHNHAGFYAQFKRTYSSWLMANPLELAMTVGAPVLLLAGLSLVRSLKGRDARSFATPVAVLGTWLLLYLSGKNSGEAARLWVLLNPAFLWAASCVFEHDSKLSGRTWWVVAVCQAAVAVLSVGAVSGFGLLQ